MDKLALTEGWKRSERERLLDRVLDFEALSRRGQQEELMRLYKMEMRSRQDGRSESPEGPGE